MKTSTKIIIATVTTFGIASGVFAFGAHKFKNMSMHDKAEMINERVSSRLDLNETQETKLETLTDRMATLVQEAKNKSGNHKAMISSFINDQPLDQAAILEKINSKTSVINQHAPEMVGLLANFVDSLNAEQKEEIKEMMEKRFSRHGKHHDNEYGKGMMKHSS